MFVEIKPLSSLNQLSVRADADSQMRRRFAEFYDTTPSRFTGISAFGHIVCKYELNKGDDRIIPTPIPGSDERVVDVAPRMRWDLDLTTSPGATRILDIFQQVKDVMLKEGV